MSVRSVVDIGVVGRLFSLQSHENSISLQHITFLATRGNSDGERDRVHG
jgi:hypothetical protein